MDIEITLRVNGAAHRLVIDTRTTLLDALRSILGSLALRKAATTGSAAPVPFCLMAGA